MAVKDVGNEIGRMRRKKNVTQQMVNRKKLTENRAKGGTKKMQQSRRWMN
jgi:hypothetical protein